MATYTIRGTSHNVVYTYKAADGKRKQQWESYSSELEAIQRKAYIDIFKLRTGHLILHMKHPSIGERKPSKRQLKKLLLKRQQLLPILRPLKAKTI